MQQIFVLDMGNYNGVVLVACENAEEINAYVIKQASIDVHKLLACVQLVYAVYVITLKSGRNSVMGLTKILHPHV